MNFDLLSAFVIGALGSAHCIGMCGGITTMLTSAIGAGNSRLPLILSYHIGRIGSYAALGAIVGYSGSLAIKGVGIPLEAMRLFAGIFIVLLGLYIGQWYLGIKKIEHVGGYLWRYISPLTKKVIPVTNIKRATALGILWGWLPCGLVYSTLTWALASSSPLQGAAIMIAFGLGTLPALVAVSLGLFKLREFLAHPSYRKLFAFMIIIYGFYAIFIASRQLF